MLPDVAFLRSECKISPLGLFDFSGRTYVPTGEILNPNRRK